MSDLLEIVEGYTQSFAAAEIIEERVVGLFGFGFVVLG